MAELSECYHLACYALYPAPLQQLLCVASFDCVYEDCPSSSVYMGSHSIQYSCCLCSQFYASCSSGKAFLLFLPCYFCLPLRFHTCSMLIVVTVLPTFPFFSYFLVRTASILSRAASFFISLRITVTLSVHRQHGGYLV